ncbi:hypothetical protein TNCV_895851 [Trichonephila clavipes]|nr:hypothetical protein TNCV_895851 [Trichonephila clavipes]
MVVKRDGGQLKPHPHHLTMVQNVEVGRQKLSNEENFFIRAIAYGCSQKQLLTDAQWRNCESVFSEFLNVEKLPFDKDGFVESLMKKVLKIATKGKWLIKF